MARLCHGAPGALDTIIARPLHDYHHPRPMSIDRHRARIIRGSQRSVSGFGRTAAHPQNRSAIRRESNQIGDLSPDRLPHDHATVAAGVRLRAQQRAAGPPHAQPAPADAAPVPLSAPGRRWTRVDHEKCRYPAKATAMLLARSPWSDRTRIGGAITERNTCASRAPETLTHQGFQAAVSLCFRSVTGESVE
jgi:hypothetical protein